MEIKDKDRNIRIKFSDFNKLYNNEPVFVDLLIEITMDIAIAKDSITIELSDFEEFVENLKKLNEKLAHTFFFQHLDEQLQIKFKSARVSCFWKFCLCTDFIRFEQVFYEYFKEGIVIQKSMSVFC